MEYHNLLISGLPGSGKSTLIRRLSEIYQIPVISIGDTLRERWKKEYPNEEIPFDAYFRSIPETDLVRINLDLKQRVTQGGVIVDTRFPPLVENERSTKLFVKANLEVRVERAFVNQKNNLSKNEIKRILLQREQDELKRGKELVSPHYDYRDIGNYHIQLDTSNLTIEQEIDLIINPDLPF